MSHLRGDDGEFLPYFFNDHLGFLADFQLLSFYSFLSFVLFLQLLDKLLCVVDFLSLIFYGFFSVLDRFLLVHDVHFQLASDNLFAADHVFNGLYCGADFLGNLESLVLFSSEGLNLLFLLLHFFPEGGAYLFLPFDFLPQIFEFGLHSHNLNVQIFSTFSIVIRRIFDFQSDFLLFLFFFLKFCVLFFNVENSLHIELQISLKVLDSILGLLVHGLILLDVNLKLIQFGLHFLLCIFEVILHLLFGVDNLFLQLICLEKQVLIGGLLRLVCNFCGFKSSG